MKKRNSCIITRIWPSVEDMKKDLFIDLNKQEITRISTGNKLKPFLQGKKLSKDKRHYVITFKKSHLFIHRLFFYLHHGYLPKLVDHKDTNPQNNKIDNLRELDNSGNSRNSHKMKKNTSSKYKGVCWYESNKKWRAYLYLNGKFINIGLYINEDDAGQAYNDKIRELGLEEISVMNNTPQERARKLSLFDNLEPITNLK
jgi:hypothetical protein